MIFSLLLFSYLLLRLRLRLCLTIVVVFRFVSVLKRSRKIAFHFSSLSLLFNAILVLLFIIFDLPTIHT